MKILSIMAFQVTPGVENLSAGKDNDLFIWIALAAGILALGLGIYLFTLISSLKKNNNKGISNVFSSEKSRDIDVKADEDEKVKLEQRLGELEQRLYSLENPGRIKEWSSEEIAAVKTGAANRPSSVTSQAAAGKTPGTAEGKSTGERATEGKSLNEKLAGDRLREEKQVKNEFIAEKSNGAGKSVDSGLTEREPGNTKLVESEPGKGESRDNDLGNGESGAQQSGVKQAESRLTGENLADKNALQGKLFDANEQASKTPAEKLPEVKLPEIQLLFAKLPDIENGFSAEVLSPVQDGEQIYEIKVKDDQGTYEISQTTDAQKYALSDANYYLSGACDFQNQPSKDSKISTRRKGKLIKSGTQWIIQEKASIEFI